MASLKLGHGQSEAGLVWALYIAVGLAGHGCRVWRVGVLVCSKGQSGPPQDMAVDKAVWKGWLLAAAARLSLHWSV